MPGAVRRGGWLADTGRVGEPVPGADRERVGKPRVTGHRADAHTHSEPGPSGRCHHCGPTAARIEPCARLALDGRRTVEPPCRNRTDDYGPGPANGADMGTVFGWIVAIFIIFLIVANPAQAESFGIQIVNDVSTTISRVVQQATTSNTSSTTNQQRAPAGRDYRLD